MDYTAAPAMKLPLPAQRISWQTTGLALAAAVVAAWGAGYVIGLAVRIMFGP